MHHIYIIVCIITYIIIHAPSHVSHPRCSCVSRAIYLIIIITITIIKSWYVINIIYIIIYAPSRVSHPRCSCVSRAIYLQKIPQNRMTSDLRVWHWSSSSKISSKLSSNVFHHLKHLEQYIYRKFLKILWPPISVCGTGAVVVQLVVNSVVMYFITWSVWHLHVQHTSTRTVVVKLF